MLIKGPIVISLLWLDAIAMGLVMPVFLVQLFNLGDIFLNPEDGSRYMSFFLGFIIAFFPPGALILVFLGWLADKWNYMFVLWLGLCSTAICFICLLLTDKLNPYMFFFCIILFCLRAGGIATAKALISIAYRGKQRAIYFGFYTTRYTILGFVFYLVAYSIARADHPEFNETIFISAALFCILSAIAFLGIAQNKIGWKIYLVAHAYRIGKNTFNDFLLDVGSLLSNNKRVLILLCVFLLLQFGYGIFEQYQDSYFVHNYSYQATDLSSHRLFDSLYFFTHYYIDGIRLKQISFFGPLISILLLLFIYIQLVRFIRIKHLILVSSTVCLILTLSIFFIHGMQAKQILFLLITRCLLSAFILPVIFTLIADAAPLRSQGILMGAVEVLWRLGWILSGMVIDDLHFQHSLFPIFTAALSFGAQWILLTWLLIGRKKIITLKKN